MTALQLISMHGKNLTATAQYETRDQTGKVTSTGTVSFAVSQATRDALIADAQPAIDALAATVAPQNIDALLSTKADLEQQIATKTAALAALDAQAEAKVTP